jgi:hypothetical protein
VAVFHRAHTSGFCSACSSYRTAWRSQWTLLSLSASVVPPVVKRQAPWANGVHGVADGGATSVTASFDVHLLLQLISAADPELRCPSTTGTNHPQTESNQDCAGVRNVQPVLCHLRRHLPGLYPRADSRRRARGRQRGHPQVRLASLLHFLVPHPSSRHQCHSEHFLARARLRCAASLAAGAHAVRAVQVQ